MFRFTLLPFCLLIVTITTGQKIYTPEIQASNCRFVMDTSMAVHAPAVYQNPFFQLRVDSGFQTQCGYLIVPENRNNSSSKMIRLPYIVLKSRNPHKKNDPVLFTSGGPGNSSLEWINGMSRSLVIGERDCIVLEQRGTRYAIPYLRSLDLDTAIKTAYRYNLPKDSMWMVGVKNYKTALEQRDIDVSGYNTEQTIADIGDLLSLLRIDSVNLFGGSYSGGLMMGVAKTDRRVRSLVLDSPLPMFSPIDEDEPVNFIKALKLLSDHAAKDSAHKIKYGNLFKDFNTYFSSIINTPFSFRYTDQPTQKVLDIQYGKNELLELIASFMNNSTGLSKVPHIIHEIVNGRHQPLIMSKIDNLLRRYTAPDGMRMSVYCADQAAYNDEKKLDQFYKSYPYMKGFHINNVWKAVCDIWNVPPLNPELKKPFYSSVPVLVGDGEMDPACSPAYMKDIKKYFKNTQAFLFINRSHGVGSKEFYELTHRFLNEPLKKLKLEYSSVIEY